MANSNGSKIIITFSDITNADFDNGELHGTIEISSEKLDSALITERAGQKRTFQPLRAIEVQRTFCKVTCTFINMLEIKIYEKDKKVSLAFIDFDLKKPYISKKDGNIELG